MKLLWPELVIHKKEIEYDPMSHFHDEIQNRLDKIEKIVVTCKDDAIQ